ncbi:MAG: hypothetical protein ACQZ3N_05595 [cyanobacterium endosymbiont of Rhopalodia yunnanensis]
MVSLFKNNDDKINVYFTLDFDIVYESEDNAKATTNDHVFELVTRQDRRVMRNIIIVMDIM